MVILHFAAIRNASFAGVSVAVPQHVNAQREMAQVALVNLVDEKIDTVEYQFFCKSDFSLEDLPQPFDRPDIVVFHETYRPDYLKIYPLLLKKRIPYVIIPHGELSKVAQKKKWLKKKLANLLLFNRFINHAAAVQCLSQREMEMTHFGKHKFVGTNGVYMPDKAKTSFHTDCIKFIYIGRLEMHIKGLDLLLDAVKAKADLLRQHHCTFDLYGPDILGRAAAVAELIEKNGVGDIVTLHPPISGVEKENALLDADVFIQTSRSEGMPMGILEALSYGLPCLVTEGTTLAYFVNEQRVGWGCETNSKAVAEMMEKACVEYGSLLEKSTRAREAILGNFAWDVVARDTVERYEEIVKQQWQNADRKGG